MDKIYSLYVESPDHLESILEDAESALIDSYLREKEYGRALETFKRAGKYLESRVIDKGDLKNVGADLASACVEL